MNPRRTEQLQENQRELEEKIRELDEDIKDLDIEIAVLREEKRKLQRLKQTKERLLAKFRDREVDAFWDEYWEAEVPHARPNHPLNRETTAEGEEDTQ